MIRYLERHSSRFSTGAFSPPETVPWRGVEKPIYSYGWGLILNDVHYKDEKQLRRSGHSFSALFRSAVNQHSVTGQRLCPPEGEFHYSGSW
ncbi:hypothetical protein CEXT_731761 [Caerostris extrusa]|uniref:Uncharacterized protein n=1 Tax=Caerostris extrusa TaxID=172846 RepID=A0AAV4NDU7_CAEEX|nr:hypothetical protein CEXT_731761 [Caerostris extrusa]